MCVRGVRGPSGAVTRRFPRSPATWGSGEGPHPRRVHGRIRACRPIGIGPKAPTGLKRRLPARAECRGAGRCAAPRDTPPLSPPAGRGPAHRRLGERVGSDCAGSHLFADLRGRLLGSRRIRLDRFVGSRSYVPWDAPHACRGRAASRRGPVVHQHAARPHEHRIRDPFDECESRAPCWAAVWPALSAFWSVTLRLALDLA